MNCHDYNTPGRLAFFRRRFENAYRRPGLDPATFATELGILALRGFSDMKEKARDLMVGNKSHTESIVTDDWNSVYSQPIQPKTLPGTSSSSQSQSKVGSMMPELMGSPRRVVRRPGERELLIRNVLEAVGARRNVTSHRSRSK